MSWMLSHLVGLDKAVFLPTKIVTHVRLPDSSITSMFRVSVATPFPSFTVLVFISNEEAR